jgi:hypothetical protein
VVVAVVSIGPRGPSDAGRRPPPAPWLGDRSDRAGAAAAGGRDDVLIRVHASTVSAADHRARHRGVPHGPWQIAAFGIGTSRPRRRALGMDVAVALDRADEQTPDRP